MDTPKPGEITSDGKAINIGAPIIEARVSTTFQPPPEPTASQILAMMVRHLKGFTSQLEDLRAHVERFEKK